MAINVKVKMIAAAIMTARSTIYNGVGDGVGVAAWSRCRCQVTAKIL